jgi:hypothetical protein
MISLINQDDAKTPIIIIDLNDENKKNHKIIKTQWK